MPGVSKPQCFAQGASLPRLTSTYGLDRARLRPLSTLFFGEVNFHPDLHLIEGFVQYTVPMKIDLTPVTRFEEAEIFLRKQLANLGNGNKLMGLYLAAPTPCVIL